MLGTAALLAELDASFCGNNTCAEDGTRCYCDVDTADRRCLCAPGYQLSTTDTTPVCRRKSVPASSNMSILKDRTLVVWPRCTMVTTQDLDDSTVVGWNSANPLYGNGPTQVDHTHTHTHVPLSPSSIGWYQSYSSDALRPGR